VLGHYSRWHASPTTFGPEIKIGLSVFLVGMLALALFFVFFILWFVQLFVSGWLLKELWRPGWIAAEPVGHRSAPSASLVEPLREGFRVPSPPERYDPLPPGPRAVGEILGLALLGMYAFFRSSLR
jgi:hypothetical protein